ncbi:MAG: DNA repair protein RecO [Geoalkalibacter sp.]|jgi:DNA repair protein RecO (recombination protein O)|uniref:DNA repair protein RecO n=1 Tax=Geoalkalibacter sp. TaxID=3041440 RepID=UPI002A965FA1|nr:DNA repair protein RecO [Thermodesulfobacteriota bacterium]
MKLLRSEAIVLRRIDYGEADRIVTLYARDAGLIKGFAAHARGSRRRFGAALEPFARITLHWQSARGDGLARLREAELQDLRPDLRAELDTLSLAAYGCEVLEALFADGEPHADVFDVLEAYLAALPAGTAQERAAFKLLFELRLLRAAGYLPHLLHCAECGETATPSQVAFSAERGGRLCPSCAGSDFRLRLSPLTLGTLARCLNVAADRFTGFRFGPLTLSEGAAVLGDALRVHLPHALRSQAFVDRFLENATPRQYDKNGL